MNVRLPLLMVAMLVAALLLALVRAPARSLSAVQMPQGMAEGVLKQSLQLRMLGRFDEAESLLRARLEQQQDPEVARALLGILEDSGKVDVFVEESRRYRTRWPDDPFGDWCLARGLLFAAALDPQHGAAQREEARHVIERLDAIRWAPVESPGARTILWMQLAFLEHDWTRADQLAQEAIRLGTTTGEAADLQTIRLDLALRAGRMKEARQMLDACLETVKSWRGAPVYYQLFPYREAAVFVRLTYYGEHITRDQINAPQSLYQTLAAKGLQERLALSLVQEFLLRYVELDEKQDYAEILTEMQAFFNHYPPPHMPTCFYGETLYLPVVAAAAQLHMGDLCVRLGRKDEARKHYEAGLAVHPDDVTLKQRLERLTP